MEIAINSVCLLFVIAIEIAAYVILIGSVFPKYIMKIRLSIIESTDRGLKKYIFPSGCGVVYEPHPSVRKYVPKYALFTNDGYKYVKCLLDKEVKELTYNVVMFNNQNKIVDVIDVSEKIGTELETEPLLIHQDTSYIALTVCSVNGEMTENRQLFYCRLRDIGLYAAAVTLLSFFEFIFLTLMLSILDTWVLKSGITDNLSPLSFVFPALIIGAVACGITYINSIRKGVRWSK